VIDQVSGSLNHTTYAAGRAKTPTLSGKSDEMLVTATIAFNPQKSVFQATTSEVVIELLGNESSQLDALFGNIA